MNDTPLTIDPKDPEVIKIMGTVCFVAGPIAHVLNLGGANIPQHAEEEQAHVILWLLSVYLEHGMDWRRAGGEKLKEIKAAHQEKLANENRG